MTYLADESSVANANVVELFKFDGTFVTYYYTSGPRPIVYDDGDTTGPQTYVPIAIERTEVKGGTQDDDGLDITVSLPATETLVQDYGFGVSPPDLKLTIYRMEPSETVTYWIGPVTNINVDQSDNGRASIKCPSVLGAALVGNVPDIYYQTPCNHTLYDGRCKVDYAANSAVVTIASISADGKTIGVNTIGALGGKLIGGELALGTGEVRMITAQVGTALTVNFPFASIALGGAATIAAGCDYAYLGDCKSKFNNQINFGGFVFIPPINPFADGIQPAEEGVTDDACVFVAPTYWASVNVVTNLGPNIPVIGPWSWQIIYSRGGVEICHLYSSGGGNGTGPVYNGGGEHGVLPLVYLNGWQTLVDLPHNATDPFAAGPPDHVHINLQWPYSNWIFPGDSLFGGDHGDMTVNISNGVFSLTTPPFSGIFGLWPSSWDFDL
jgi:hypothetical protein